VTRRVDDGGKLNVTENGGENEAAVVVAVLYRYRDLLNHDREGILVVVDQLFPLLMEKCFLVKEVKTYGGVFS